MNEKYTENVRVRLTPSQKKFIDTIAKSNRISSSDVVRDILFDEKSPSPYFIALQNNLPKNELMNIVQRAKITKSAKEKIMKELNTNG